eukprot:GHVS01096362.1.p1 GENE.GHVS01096362.1~~GHVS01096362.1.p1  ORF type:complete len:115 (+),score=47.28 GHVS01096362.1:2-346(+)
MKVEELKGGEMKGEEMKGGAGGGTKEEMKEEVDGVVKATAGQSKVSVVKLTERKAKRKEKVRVRKLAKKLAKKAMLPSADIAAQRDGMSADTAADEDNKAAVVGTMEVEEEVSL